MACESCGDKPKKCNKDFTRTVVEINNPGQITLMRKVTVPASMGDDTTVPPVVGKYKNVLLFYEANSKSYLYSSDGIPTLLANGLTDYEQAVNLPQINGVTLTGNKTSGQLGLQPTLSVAPGTGIKLEDNELSGLPATGTTIGMVKPGDGLEVDASGTMSISDIEQYAHFFDTVADMKAATNLVAGDYAKTLGFHSKNDGGGALYTIRNNGTANEKDVISVANDLLAILVVDNSNVYPEQFGAYGDGTHDDSAVIQYVVDNYTVIKFKAKEYKVNSGILIQGNHTLIGDNENYMNAYVGALGTVFTGNNKTSVGMRIYNDDNSSISVHIENITLQEYTNGIYAITCVCSTFKNVICRKNNTGLKITGTCYENKWDHCQFFRNTEDGFLCGITDTHPVLGTTLTPSMSTEDFYSCAFAKNGRHGVHGFLTTTNFFGGFCEENGEAGVYLLSTTGKTVVKDTFIGFDIENERVGYFFDSTDPNRLELTDIAIIGGQVTLLNENDYVNAIIYLKGVSITFDYVYNIFFRTRKAVPAAAYDIYAEATNGSATSICIDTNNGNRNNKLKTNVATMYSDCLNSYNGELPLRAFGGYCYDESSDTIVIPAGKSLSFSLNNLVLLSQLKLTLSTDSTFRVSVYGRKVIDYAQNYNNNNVTGVLTDGKYVMTLNPGAKADVITITNKSASDAVIESSNIVGYFYQY